jgi:hypothetical protein
VSSLPLYGGGGGGGLILQRGFFRRPGWRGIQIGWRILDRVDGKELRQRGGGVERMVRRTGAGIK